MFFMPRLFKYMGLFNPHASSIREISQQCHHCTDNYVLAAFKQKPKMGVREEHSQDNTRAPNMYQSFHMLFRYQQGQNASYSYSLSHGGFLWLGNEERKGEEVYSCYYQMYSSLSRPWRNSKERQIKVRKKKNTFSLNSVVVCLV